MNNLLSYCGLVDAKIRASDKDLPVDTVKSNGKISQNFVAFSEYMNFRTKSAYVIYEWPLSLSVVRYRWDTATATTCR